MIDATLTLPGIAGIVLTVGMAVDANVLIYERIREELRHGLSPQAAIYAGYERAFATILDANVTTLIVAIILICSGYRTCSWICCNSVFRVINFHANRYYLHSGHCELVLWWSYCEKIIYRYLRRGSDGIF